ncbi:MAG: electron transfer flavoprotein subunit alpha/FixB family protein [Candidatus Marinimicrobia bacterium]|nr:electron transfer flavoprotein subunit alpha/FixB family protein [Candidatus Neomarinimicrobiota bacterium]MBL7022580.1 electron transfer flavoprotein subunit alpha/FixB family protein [Candidatus Neomarinimicrobiota bacterium]MBL7108936.1 electron transfer flavoprotein subunit alpha/FixB family protein [Candidatus Neomarinimicrobiota bacterium]
MMKIFIFIQQENGTVNRASLEALSGAQKVAESTGGNLSAITFNNDVAQSLTSYNLSEILLANQSELADYNPLNYISALQQTIDSEKPDIVLFAHTYEARDWIPRLGARLNVPFVADCIGFKNEDELMFIRQIYQGKINSDISVSSSPILASFQPGSYRVDEVSKGNASIRELSLDLSTVAQTVRPGEKFQEAKGEVDLSRAEIILSIGRGVGKEENLPVVKELAESLGAELGASRPVVDYEWLPHERQVGSSGQTVSPKLYVAVGISGAVQHLVGMKGSDNIIAINKDENAPIFEVADIGVIADLFEIVPKLTEAIKNR